MEQYEKGFQRFHTSFYFGALKVGREPEQRIQGLSPGSATVFLLF